MTQTEATQSRSPSQFNIDRTYPDRWTVTSTIRRWEQPEFLTSELREAFKTLR